MKQKKDINAEQKPIGEDIKQEDSKQKVTNEEHAQADSKGKKSEVERYEKEISEFKHKVEESNDKYLRLAAEFDNFRRRAAKERLDLVNSAGEDVIVGFLPILDDCERALQVLAEADGDKASREGTELIYNKLYNYLKSRGLERIETSGQKFNTDFHEAVAQFPVEKPDQKDKIIDIVQQGYTLHGKVVRFAKVVVGV